MDGRKGKGLEEERQGAREQGSKGAREQIRVRRGKREWGRRKRSRGIERCEED